MTTELAITDNNDLIPTGKLWDDMKNMAKILVETKFLPDSVKTPQQAVAIMLKGREIGIPPMQAFGQINVIKGKPCVSPELMMALIYKNIPAARINFVKNDNQACTIEAQRYEGQAVQSFSFTIEDAKAAGLAGKDNWKKYTRAMLRSRCVGEMARSVFPDAVAGCGYTPEEMGANVNENNEVVEQPKPDPPIEVEYVRDSSELPPDEIFFEDKNDAKETLIPNLAPSYNEADGKVLLSKAVARILATDVETIRSIFQLEKHEVVSKIINEGKTIEAMKRLDRGVK